MHDTAVWTAAERATSNAYPAKSRFVHMDTLAFVSQLFESNADTARVVHRPLSEAKRVVELVGDVVNRFAPNGIKALCVGFVNEPSIEIAAVELIGHERVVLFRLEKENLAEFFRGILDDSEESHEPFVFSITEESNPHRRALFLIYIFYCSHHPSSRSQICRFRR